MNFISKDNQTYNVSNLSEFCKQNSLDSSAMHKVLRGERKSHKGFKVLPETQSDNFKTPETNETDLRLEILELKFLLAPILKEREKAEQRRLEETGSVKKIWGKK
jgi:hypothetical protein